MSMAAPAPVAARRAFTALELLVGVAIVAVLFGLLGMLLAAAAFRPALRPLALIGGFVSVVSFFALAYGIDGANAQVMRVATVDWVAFACLAIAATLHLREPRSATAGDRT